MTGGSGLLQRLRQAVTGRSIRSRLVLGVALVHAVLMTMFITDLVHRQRSFLNQQSANRALGLARMVSVNSVSWVLANDVRGLAEVMGAVRGYPDVLYAMVIDPNGKVLAHTEEDKLEQYVVDPVSRALLGGPPLASQTVVSAGMREAAAPVIVHERLIGWVRIGLDQRSQTEALRAALLEGLVYTVIAILVGTLFAVWMAGRLAGPLLMLGQKAGKLSEGERTLAPLPRAPAEIEQLDRSFTAMARIIWKREDELAQAARQIKASHAELEQFTEVLAHHLQEPVRLQHAFVQRLLHLIPVPRPPEIDQALSFVAKGAVRLRSLLRDVQLYLSLGQLPPASHPCPADHALELAQARLQGKIDDCGARIERTALPTVWIELSRLTDLFAIVLDNALEFRRPEVPLRIMIAARPPEAGRVVLTVTDNGIGIDPDFHERVFRVFERLNPEQGRPGTGIGLALARKIVETAHGGIWIEDAPGGGTRVCFSLSETEERIDAGRPASAV